MGTVRFSLRTGMATFSPLQGALGSGFPFDFSWSQKRRLTVFWTIRAYVQHIQHAKQPLGQALFLAAALFCGPRNSACPFSGPSVRTCNNKFQRNFPSGGWSVRPSVLKILLVFNVFVFFICFFRISKQEERGKASAKRPKSSQGKQ